MTKTDQRVSRPKATRLPLSMLKTEPCDFQFREFETTEDHVRGLVEALQAGQILDPMTVWKRKEGDYVVVDGHHRHEAYCRCKFTKAVPVVVHEGSESQAMLLALAENTKTKLPMTKTERENAAWRLTCSELTFSKAKTAAATGVSARTVARMRAIKRKLLEQDKAVPERWWAAMMKLKGLLHDELSDDERKGMIESRANALDSQIGAEIGRVGNQQWEALAEVLERRLEHVNLLALVGHLHSPFLYDDEDEDPLF